MVSPCIRQTWAISGVLLTMLSAGMMLGFTSSLLPALSDPGSSIQADLNTRSWIASSVGFAGLPGPIVSSFLMGIYGRRITQIIAILPAIVGWLMIYFSTGVPTLLIGRIITGYSAGASVVLGAVIVGEYSSPSLRGTFLNLKTASLCMGGLLMHILGHFLTWRVTALVSVIPSFLVLCITYTWPESPAWLASTQQYERAKNDFIWLRGNDEQSMKEIEDLIKTEMNKKQPKKSLNKIIVAFFKKFTKKNFLRPVFITFTGNLLIEASGRHVFPAYALDIMGEITGNKSQSFYSTLAIDMIITISATFSSFLAKILRRRTQLFGSGLASILVLASACTYLFLASRGVISNENTWIPISLFVLYFIVVNLGCTPIPLAFVGELLPLEHRGIGAMLTGISAALSIHLSLQVTPYLLHSVKVYGTFTVFGACIVVLLLYLYFALPECKDRTLQDIDFFFKNGYFADDVIYGECDDVKMKMLYNDVNLIMRK